MKLVVQDAPTLKAAVDSIVCLVEEGQFEIKNDGLYFRAMDPSQISMISFRKHFGQPSPSPAGRFTSVIRGK